MLKTTKKGKTSRAQNCCECGDKIVPLLIIGDDAENWIFEQCDECFDALCPNCITIHENAIFCSCCAPAVQSA